MVGVEITRFHVPDHKLGNFPALRSVAGFGLSFTPSMTAILIIGIVTALGAAVRGNWSPCGESLQAQIHPLGENARGNVWGVTMTSFTVASMAAGGALTANDGVARSPGSWP